MRHFELVQRWEGFVLEVKENSFIARLIDLTEEGPEEEAEFPLEEIYKDDRKLITPGAVFYWNIGYLDSSSGRTRASIVRFRRLPAWTVGEIKEAKREAQRIKKALKWE